MTIISLPDHIHFILRVKSAMKKGIAFVIRGFWQGAKKAGNLYASSVFPDNIRIHYTFSFVGRLMSWTKQTKKEPACSVVEQAGVPIDRVTGFSIERVLIAQAWSMLNHAERKSARETCGHRTPRAGVGSADCRDSIPTQ